jgi:hypothetical protein
VNLPSFFCGLGDRVSSKNRKLLPESSLAGVISLAFGGTVKRTPSLYLIYFNICIQKYRITPLSGQGEKTAKVIATKRGEFLGSKFFQTLKV